MTKMVGYFSNTVHFGRTHAASMFLIFGRFALSLIFSELTVLSLKMKTGFVLVSRTHVLPYSSYGQILYLYHTFL